MDKLSQQDQGWNIIQVADTKKSSSVGNDVGLRPNLRSLLEGNSKTGFSGNPDPQLVFYAHGGVQSCGQNLNRSILRGVTGFELGGGPRVGCGRRESYRRKVTDLNIDRKKKNRVSTLIKL